MPRALLPPGCYDLLPPHAARVAEVEARLLSAFASFGYEQVAPPLMEYTESLLAGRGAEFSGRIFRMMDPETQKVMGIRADMTLQVGRIAAHRMGDAPRPLRLSYSGPILRLNAAGLHEKRQFTQAGIELIGAQSAAADAEVIFAGASALSALGVPGLVVDMNMPGLLALLLAEEALEEEEAKAVLHAVAHKDASAIRGVSAVCRARVAALLEAAGPAARALEKIRALDLPASVRPLLAQMEELHGLLEPLQARGVTLMIDPLESRGFEYHQGVSFSFFSGGAAQELGRGGHYRIEGEEAATGLTLYLDSLQRLLPAHARAPRAFIAGGLGDAGAEELRARGFATLYALDDGDAEEQARRLRCTHLYRNGELVALQD